MAFFSFNLILPPYTTCIGVTRFSKRNDVHLTKKISPCAAILQGYYDDGEETKYYNEEKNIANVQATSADSNVSLPLQGE
jgi:hypothetical protein